MNSEDLSIRPGAAEPIYRQIVEQLRQRGKGMVVAASRRRIQTDDRRLEQLEPGLTDVVRQARELGLADRLVLERLKELLEQEK
jgi:DNA-binding transcriptional regulator YhcF (GntR family)